jgi:hypothetical protein
MALMIALRLQGNQLITPSAPNGILSLELSTDADHSARIASEWVGSIRNAFYINMLLDFIFIIFYGFSLYVNCRYIALIIPSWKRLASLFAIGSLIAMGSDVMENILMIVSVTTTTSQIISFFTRLFAILKFSLVGASLVFIIIRWLSYYIKKLKKANA